MISMGTEHRKTAYRQQDTTLLQAVVAAVTMLDRTFQENPSPAATPFPYLHPFDRSRRDHVAR